MQLRAYSLDFILNGNITFPKDVQLHDLAVKYVQEQLSDSINLTDYRKVFLVGELDHNNVPVAINGIACGIVTFDWSVIRFTHKAAGPVLFERMRHYHQDQGLSGQKVLIHVADHEPKESRCPEWRKWLREMNAEKASRWSVTV